jgi:hypothetical protein
MNLLELAKIFLVDEKKVEQVLKKYMHKTEHEHLAKLSNLQKRKD